MISFFRCSSDSSDDNEDRVERHICSDTEAERKPRSDSNDITWEWGMLPEVSLTALH